MTYETDGTNQIYYTYDSDGNLISMNLNGTEYYYIKDAQGDIIGLFDSTGTQVVSYTYDTWGKLISTTGSLASTVGALNPYRYRDYMYDSETGLYYLQSRYYNPEWGRFINADTTDILQQGVGTLLSQNMFAYCINNPVMYIDPTGAIPEEGEVPGEVFIEGLETESVLEHGVTSPTPETNLQMAKQVAKETGGRLEDASGDGWTVKIKKGKQEITIRIMNSGGTPKRYNYWRISAEHKGAYYLTPEGVIKSSNDRLFTHMDIQVKNTAKQIVSAVDQIWKKIRRV